LAIVGAACRLPGAPDLAAYWRLLAEGRDAVATLPADRFDQAQYLHPRSGEPGKTYTFAAGTLGDVAGFEPTAFGISPREAAEMDPQQRLVLELAAEAMEDAGILPTSLAGSDTGVFIGASLTDYVDLRYGDLASGDRYFMTGGALSIIANRLGNVFDLRGPAQTIDTACSSSLVALHWAASALAAGRIPAALVGGVNMLLSPFPFLGFARAGMLSPTGRCYAFDARADGYVRAEGGGVILLKRLADAEAAGDPIRGIILATGSNAAGRTMGLSLPSSSAQQALIEQVMREAGATPADFCFFEAHGTGTAIGDPLEASAIGNAIGRHRAEQPLAIGSAKANIGHTEPASGMAGLLKAMLVLEHQAVPGNPQFATPNPNIDFAGLGLTVPTRLTPLTPQGRSLAGINSFGFGGTNACAVLAPAPPRRSRRVAERGPLPPLLLSARSADGLRALAEAWAPHLAATPRAALPALLRGAARHRQPLPFRLALRAADGPALAAVLPEAAAAPTAAIPPGEGVGFVFAGNGAPWPGMAQPLAQANPAFAAALAEADAALTPLLGWSPAALLSAGVSAEQLAATEQAQPLLFAVQHAIVGALAAEGIRPAFTIGHSVGEIAAALAAGLLPMPEAARLIVARSRRQAETRGIGRMAALGCGEAEAMEALAEAGPGLEIAAINAPDALTIAGPAPALERLATIAAERRWSFVPLDLDYAFHSAAMDPLQDGLLGDLAGLAPTASRVPMFSTVTGEALDPATAGPAYWWRNLREPVRFAAGLSAAAKRQPRLLIEIGPHPVLQSYLRAGLRAAAAEAAILPSLSRRDPPGDPFPALADRAWTLGADPREGPAFAGAARRGGLPTTPFTRTRHWFARTVEATPIANRRVEHRLLGTRQDLEPGRWTQHLDVQQEPWLADHALGGQPVLPAAAMLEMALAAGAARHPDAAALELREMALLALLPLAADRPREIACTLDADGGFTLRSRPRLSDEPWTLHATGRVGPLAAFPPVPDEPPLTVGRMTGEAIRHLAARAGLQYGPAFAAVTDAVIDQTTGRALVTLAGPETAPPDADFLLHPSRFDGALQGLIGLLTEPALEAGQGLVPVRVARLVLRHQAGPLVQATLRVTARGERSAAADLVLRDADGAPIGFAQGCGFQRIRLPGSHDPAEAAFRIDLIPAEPLPGGDGAAHPALGPALAAAAKQDAALDLGDVALLLEGVCAAAAHQALAGQEAAGPYARALLAELANGGLAEAGPGGLRTVPAPDLPPPVEIWRQVLLEQPALAQELAWLALAEERLPAALAGSLAEAVVPDGPPAQGAGHGRLAEVLASAASRIAAAWPVGRPLRVLEVGAGPGPLTARLVAALAGPGRHVLYRAAALPGRPLPAPPPAMPGVVFESILWDPLGTEPVPATADLIIGLGATARLRAGTALPAALLPASAPGAALLLAEPAPGQLWDFCCGQDPGWWSGPGGASPLAGAEGWQAALAAADWGEATALPLRAAPWPALMIAGRAPATAAVLPAPKLRRVLLLADPGMAPLRAALAIALQARGATVTPADLLTEASRLAPRQLEGQLVVALAAGGSTPDALAATLAALAALAAAAEGSAAGFRLVTQGGQQPPESRLQDPAGAACFALGRVLANEHPALKPRRIDLCPSLTPDAAARRLALSLLAEASPEAEITLTAEASLVPRLRPGLPAPPLPPGRLGLAIRRPGQLDTLHWAPITLPTPGPGEVLLRIEAAGLNFRDVMWAQGLLPEEVLQAGFAGPGLGMECAGIVEAIGAGVALRPGDRVFGVAPRALATHAVTRAEALALRPDGLDPLAAASVPVAFLTAVHALEELARLEAGERVLVHGGAGAVGLAALQVALARGARVAATAGTPAKRAFLRAAGAEIVLDSRDPGFPDHLMAAWGRPGEPGAVDVVLNSLAGEAMERSLDLLRPFGRFLELGKRDFVENRRVALRPLRRNATFFAVDVDELPRAKPAAAARLLAGIANRLAAGIFRPLPTAEYAATSAEAAFRTLQASGHIGKLVLRPPLLREGQAPAPALSRAGRGTVLVVGGVQGFGLATARWLAERGAQRLVLLSRRGMATPGADAAVRDLAARGATATVIACDAADPQALAEALQTLRASLPPIRGVVQAAAVAADGAAATLEPARIAAVLAAKLRVAENLDRLTAEDPLALFLLFGSATVTVGNPGQAAYVAANAALDALARRRRAEGKPATCIAWGPIADAGMLAAAAQTAEVLRRRLGAAPMPAEQALAALPALIDSGLANAGLARVAWGEARAALAVLAEPAFAAVREAGGIEEGDLRARLIALPPAEALALLKETLAGELGRILRLPGGAVPLDAPLAGLGLDSLGGMELRVGLEQRLGMPVPLTSVSETLTVDVLAQKLAQQLHMTGEAAAIPADALALAAAHEPEGPASKVEEAA